MRPESIQKKEDDFFKDLTNSAGVKYKLTATTDIGNGVKIYSIRPEFDSYYYKTKTVKKSICLHFPASSHPRRTKNGQDGSRCALAGCKPGFPL